MALAVGVWSVEKVFSQWCIQFWVSGILPTGLEALGGNVTQGGVFCEERGGAPPRAD